MGGGASLLSSCALRFEAGLPKSIIMLNANLSVANGVFIWASCWEKEM
jgi:hypothetical protein